METAFSSSSTALLRIEMEPSGTNVIRLRVPQVPRIWGPGRPRTSTVRLPLENFAVRTDARQPQCRIVRFFNHLYGCWGRMSIERFEDRSEERRVGKDCRSELFPQ